MSDRDNAENVSVEEALRLFGWTCGPEFDKRYFSDTWVFNLANAVQRLTSENMRLRRQLDEAQLRSIEARNPGIDMDEVRRSRNGSYPPSPPSITPNNTNNNQKER